MKITIADHRGMCFGVRDALRTTIDLAKQEPLTILGELVHNPIVRERLHSLGAGEGDLDQSRNAETSTVVITAHGSAESQKQSWRARGHRVVDTTCPLVMKAHRVLEALVLAGYHPVVVGKMDHVEVRGLTKDLPESSVLLYPEEAAALPMAERYGVVAQTTQPLDHVRNVVDAIRNQFPESEVRFVDTVCQPTKDRQNALAELCRTHDTIVVVGGNNSNNTAQLTAKARSLGCRAIQVENASQLKRESFTGSAAIGVTAGTSTLEETLLQVVDRLRAFFPDCDGGKISEIPAEDVLVRNA